METESGTRAGDPPLASPASLSARLPLLLALAIGVGLLLLDRSLVAQTGEPLLLRWVRKAAEHPGRSTLAVFLGLLGIWPGKPPESPLEARSPTVLDSGLGSGAEAPIISGFTAPSRRTSPPS